MLQAVRRRVREMMLVLSSLLRLWPPYHPPPTTTYQPTAAHCLRNSAAAVPGRAGCCCVPFWVYMTTALLWLRSSSARHRRLVSRSGARMGVLGSLERSPSLPSACGCPICPNRLLPSPPVHAACGPEHTGNISLAEIQEALQAGE